MWIALLVCPRAVAEGRETRAGMACMPLEMGLTVLKADSGTSKSEVVYCFRPDIPQFYLPLLTMGDSVCSLWLGLPGEQLPR